MLQYNQIVAYYDNHSKFIMTNCCITGHVYSILTTDHDPFLKVHNNTPKLICILSPCSNMSLHGISTTVHNN